MSCIDSQTYDDAYTTSIVAYAYTLYAPNDPRTAAVIDKLMDMAITGKCCPLTCIGSNVGWVFISHVSVSFSHSCQLLPLQGKLLVEEKAHVTA